jgi:hypothetical protein
MGQLFFRALRTQSFEHVVNGAEDEAVGQWYDGYVEVFQAEGAVAAGTEEVCVLIVDGAVAVVAAYGILQCSGAVVDGMDEAMEEEERQGSRDGGFVEVGEVSLEVGQRHSLIPPRHLAEDEQSGRGGPYVAVLELMYEKVFVGHHSANLHRKNEPCKLLRIFYRRIFRKFRIIRNLRNLRNPRNPRNPRTIRNDYLPAAAFQLKMRKKKGRVKSADPA